MCSFLLMEVQNCPLEFAKQHGALHSPCDWHTLQLWISLGMKLLAKALEILTLELSGRLSLLWENAILFNSTMLLGFLFGFTLFIDVLDFDVLCSTPRTLTGGTPLKNEFIISTCANKHATRLGNLIPSILMAHTKTFSHCMLTAKNASVHWKAEMSFLN